MTAPVVLARRWPILAVCIVAVATIANGLLWDDIVRCGAAVPALLYIRFAVGSRSRLGSDGRPTGSWLRPLLGLGLALVAVVAQGIWDPALGADFYPFGIPLVLIAWGAGIGWATVEGPATRLAGTGQLRPSGCPERACQYPQPRRRSGHT